MEQNRRSGTDRRKEQIPCPVERRHNTDRRELLNLSDRTRQRLLEMPVFDGMTIQEIIKIVAVCSKKELPINTKIYGIGEESDEMLILVKGKISVVSRGGVELQSYEPYDTIGEMGIFTGEPRSATVNAATDCTVLKISKVELFRVLSGERELKERFLVNLIKVISDKIRRQNDIVEELTYHIRSLEIS